MSENRPPRLRWIRERPDLNPNPNTNTNTTLSPNPSHPTYDEINPSFGWIQDSQHHYLVVNLPGFKKEDVKLETNDSGNITIKGERLKGINRRERFAKDMTMPENSNIQGISMAFEGESLRITLPKNPTKNMNQENIINTMNEALRRDDLAEKMKKLEEYIESSNVVSNEQTNNQVEDEKKRSKNELEHEKNDASRRQDHGEGDNGSSDKSVIIRIVFEKKGIVIASILSFALGFFMSQKLHHLPSQ